MTRYTIRAEPYEFEGDRARQLGMPVVHTREGRRADRPQPRRPRSIAKSQA